MKKLTCTLLVAMLTMVTTVFAQSKAGFSEKIVVTNKTTQETQSITFSDFKDLFGEGKKEGYLPELPLGIYAGDEIEISYSSNMSVRPSLAWEYFIGSYEYDGGTSLSFKFTVPKLASDNLDMRVKFDYQDVMTYPQATSPIHYVLNFKNKVVNDTRFYSEYSVLTHELRVKYVHFNDVIPYLQQPPVVSWYSADNGRVIGSKPMDSNGTVTFDTKGLTGFFIVKVIVNGVTLPTEKIILY